MTEPADTMLNSVSVYRPMQVISSLSHGMTEEQATLAKVISDLQSGKRHPEITITSVVEGQIEDPNSKYIACYMNNEQDLVLDKFSYRYVGYSPLLDCNLYENDPQPVIEKPGKQKDKGSRPDPTLDKEGSGIFPENVSK